MELVTIDSSEKALLRKRAKTLHFPLDKNTQSFIRELSGFLKTLNNPAGLAANQLGQSVQITIIQIPPEAKLVRKNVENVLPPTIFINPSYTPIPEAGKSKDWEGCFSVPGKMGEVYRYNAIHYEAYTVDGEKMAGIARGFFARALQHEIGHLNGELYIDLLCDDCRFGPLEEMMKIRKAEMEAESQ